MAGQGLLIKSFNLINGWALSNARLNLVNIQFQSPIRTLKQATKDKLRSLNIPEKPKRPLTPFFQYINEKRVALIKENPNLKLTEVVKQLSAEWKNVSAEQKEKYKQKYQKESEVYDQQILKYNSTLSEEQREGLQLAAAEKRKDKQKRKVTKLIKETEKPKRPMGPFLLYLKEQSLAKNVSQKDIMEQVRKDWAVLSDAEKKKYQTAYEKEKQKYDVELLNWEKKMLAEGHRDLVRTKTLSELEPRPSRVLDHKKQKPRE